VGHRKHIPGKMVVIGSTQCGHIEDKHSTDVQEMYDLFQLSFDISKTIMGEKVNVILD
jgi:hypothetical protein